MDKNRYSLSKEILSLKGKRFKKHSSFSMENSRFLVNAFSLKSIQIARGHFFKLYNPKLGTDNAKTKPLINKQAFF